MTADAGGRSAGLIDALYYGHLHGGARLRRIFSGDGLLQRWLDAEAALAHAQARVGLIPEEAARAIERCARADRFDQRELGDEMRAGPTPATPCAPTRASAATWTRKSWTGYSTPRTTSATPPRWSTACSQPAEPPVTARNPSSTSSTGITSPSSRSMSMRFTSWNSSQRSPTACRATMRW